MDKVRIEPTSLGDGDWNHFFRKFRPQIPDALDKAARQIKATAPLLLPSDKRLIGVVMLVNTGDFNLPLDLLFKIAERHTKAKWKGGRFSTIDAVLCITVDMIKAGQHPMSGHIVVRDAADTLLVNYTQYLYDRWVHYAAAAIGAEVEFVPGEVAPEELQLGGGVTGKIRWTPNVE